jgi:hypothetical protein
MKLIKQASGKTTIKMSKKEWTDMGKKAGWLNKKADAERLLYQRYDKYISEAQKREKLIQDLSTFLQKSSSWNPQDQSHRSEIAQLIAEVRQGNMVLFDPNFGHNFRPQDDQFWGALTHFLREIEKGNSDPQILQDFQGTMKFAQVLLKQHLQSFEKGKQGHVILEKLMQGVGDSSTYNQAWAQYEQELAAH